MLNTEQLALINGIIAGINKSYSDKHTVDEGFIARYNKEGLKFSVSMQHGERILSVYSDFRGFGYSLNKLFEVNLGYVVPETQPNGPTDTHGEKPKGEVELKMARAA